LTWHLNILENILDASKEIPSVPVVFDKYFAEGSHTSRTRQKKQPLGSCCVSTHLQPNMVITDLKHLLSSDDSKRETPGISLLMPQLFNHLENQFLLVVGLE
jgi:hypothetical protein